MASYYASAQLGAKRALLAGPFHHHDQAIDALLLAKLEARSCFSDARHWDIGWGTARVIDGHLGAGKLNDRLGLQTDAWGFVRRDRRIDRLSVERFRRQQENRPGSAMELAFKANRAHCRWCGSTVPYRRRNHNPNDSTGTFCPSDGIRRGCREAYYS